MRSGRRLAWHLGLALVLFAGLVVGTAAVAAGPASHASADPAAGRIAFETCRGCHSIPGYRNAYPNYAVPRLGGQHAAYIVAALNAYRAGRRGHNVMQAQAAALTPQQIRNIAAFLARQGKR